jgi:hypothetical protein
MRTRTYAHSLIVPIARPGVVPVLITDVVITYVVITSPGVVPCSISPPPTPSPPTASHRRRQFPFTDHPRLRRTGRARHKVRRDGGFGVVAAHVPRSPLGSCGISRGTISVTACK